MLITDQLAQLGIRLEDPAEGNFTKGIKLKALSNAQITMAQKLNDAYLTELETLDGAQVISTSLDLSPGNLGFNILRGSQGLIKVRVNGGIWATRVDVRDLKRLENDLLKASANNPLWYTFANKLYILPITITSIDIYYMKVPDPLIWTFDSNAIGGGAANDTFAAADGQGIVEVDDFYVGATIYNNDHTYEGVVTIYVADAGVGGKRLFSVTPVLPSGTFGDGETFYFKGLPYGTQQLKPATSEINASLHDVLLIFAEAEAWQMHNKLDRWKVAWEKGINEVNILNQRYQPAEGIGS